MRSVPSACSVRLPFGSAPRVCCACAPAAYAPLLPPGSAWRAHYARSCCRALVGPFQAVSAPPRFPRRSRAPPSLVRGGWPVPAPPCLALGCRLVGRPVRPGRPGAWGVCVGGGSGWRPFWGRGSARVGRGVSGGGGGGGSLCLGPSLCVPRTGTNAGFAGIALSMEGLVSILLRFVSVRSRLAAVRGGRRGAPLCTGRWLAGRPVGWLAPQLAEAAVGTVRAGDGPGACGAWTLWRSASGAAVLPGGRAGGLFLAWRGVQGRRPLVGLRRSRGLGGWRRGGWPRRGSAVPLSPFGLLVAFPWRPWGPARRPRPRPPHG